VELERKKNVIKNQRFLKLLFATFLGGLECFSMGDGEKGDKVSYGCDGSVSESLSRLSECSSLLVILGFFDSEDASVETFRFKVILGNIVKNGMK